MKRFLKTLFFLLVCLSLFLSGVDAALDHLSRSASQNSFTLYNDQGVSVLAYEGDLSNGRLCVKPGAVAAPSFLHRG